MIWIRVFRQAHPTQNIVDEIKRLVGVSQGKEQLLTSVYEGRGSTTLGVVSSEELSYICSQECRFGNRQLARILPSFLIVNKDFVLERLGAIFDGVKGDQEELERLWRLFVVNSYLVMLRTDDHKVPSPVEWLLGAFCRYNMNGDCLEEHELSFLAEQSGYKLSKRKFVDLIRSRIEMEKLGRLSASFSVMPHEFDVGTWVSMEKDESAIYDLCELSIEGTTFLAVDLLPKYIHDMDPEGTFVGNFVTRTLATDKKITPSLLCDLGGLATYYEERSDAWMKIVEPICHHMNMSGVSRNDRYGVYQSFQPKMQTWSSMAGEVAPIFIEKEMTTRGAVEATSLDSDLYEYYKWAHSRAERELQADKERVEAERHA